MAVALAVGAAVAFYVKLHMKVKHLEEKIEKNPVIAAFDEIEKRQAIGIIEELLDKWRKRRRIS